MNRTGNGGPRVPGGAGAWRVGIAAASGGTLYFLGFLGFGLWPLLGVFLVPLWWALEWTRGRYHLAASVGTGFLFGFVAYAGGHLWLWHLVDVFLAGNVWLGGVLWVAYGTWFGAGFAVYAFLFHLIRRRGWPVLVAGVPPLLAIEWMQPQLFPVHAGSALLPLPHLVQAVDLGGPLLLSALVGAVNTVAFETASWLYGTRRRPVRAWALGGVMLVLVAAYGEHRMAAVERRMGDAPSLEVGIVQANLGLLEKRQQALIAHRSHLELTDEILAQGPVDLIVWPETAYLRGIRGPLPVSGHLIRGDARVPLLFGGTLVRHARGRTIKANAAFLVNRDGMIRDVYEKNLLIPLAEYVPLAGVLPALVPLLPHTQDFGAASETPALALGPWRISSPICYEAIRPDFVRRMVRAGHPHLLVTLANDAWFGDSQEPWLHLQLARLRAIEHRRYLIRATNSGVSAIVDPLGRVVVSTGVLTRAGLRGSVQPLEIRTLYGRAGDWPGWVATLLVVLALAVTSPAQPQQ